MTRLRVLLAWTLLAGSTVGMTSDLALWLTGVISTRSMVGVTLALSWLALIFEAGTFLQVAHDRHEDVG